MMPKLSTTSRPSLSRIAALLLASTAIAGMPTAAMAQVSWNGTTSTDWFTANNWTPSAAPTATDVVTIDTVSPSTTVIDTAAANASALVLGDTGSGVLTISNGGSLTAKGAVLAQNGGSGELTLQNGAVMTLTDGTRTFDIGLNGTGQLSILSGSIVNAQSSTLGDDHGSIGTAEVNGAGSVWNNASIVIGVAGTGNVMVDNGGTLNASNILVGVGSNGTGTLDVTGTGSLAFSSDVIIGNNAGTGTVTIENNALFNNTNMIVGGTIAPNPLNSGTGTLNIQTGGVVNTTNAEIGDSGYQGTVLVDGTGSQWNISQLLRIGNGGAGSLTVTNGASVSATQGAAIGIGVGSTGILTVENGATFSVSGGELNVGGFGNGTLLVQSGGSINDALGTVQSTAIVDGAGSSWSSGEFIVGLNDGGAGNLTIQNGGTVTNGDAVVAEGGDGTVLLTGTGSSWAVSDLFIGAADTGLVTVENGATINNGTSLSVGGLSNQTNLPSSATGTLAITTGGVVTTGDTAVVGQNAGHTGIVTVDATGSAWHITNTLTVGDLGGTGTITLTNGGMLSAQTVNLGNAGSSGTVIVDGAGSTLSSQGLAAGVGGTGSLTVRNGGLLDSTDKVFMGFLAGSTGSVTITGPGSSMAPTLNLVVGGFGTGNFSLLDGAVGAADTTSIGFLNGGNGTALVNGTGSLLTTTTAFVVGDATNATGMVTISGGGTATNMGLTSIATVASATGTVTVTGTGSTLTSADVLTVGDAGTGTLNVLDNGSVSAAPAALIGNQQGSLGTLNVGSGGGFQTPMLVLGDMAGSTGTATITDVGSTVNVAQSLIVGASGAGTVSILNGGSVNADTVYLGHDASGTGTITVSDAGSKLTSASDVYVGKDGTGSLTIQNGGMVTDNDGTIGENVGSTGAASVTGAGSTWNSSDQLVIGANGNGTLAISAGGGVNDAIGGLAGAVDTVGSAVVDGVGSAWNSTSFMAIGEFGNATLTIQNGGAVTDYTASVGLLPGSVGTVIVTGAGSTWTTATSVILGGTDLIPVPNGGTGILTISQGATVSAGSVVIADLPGSVSALNIGADAASAAAGAGTLDTPTVTFGAGTGTINFNHTSDSYTFAAPISGSGTINQIAGTTFLSADSSGFTGPTNVTGGALHVNGSLTNSVVTVSSGGTLAGNGVVGRVMAGAGANIAPGNSIGTLSVNGDYNQASGSTYQAQIASNGQSDRLNISGTATIASGAILNISKTDAGPYMPDTKYTVLTAAGGVTGTYTVAGDIAQTAFSAVTASYDANDVYLTIVKTGSFAGAGQTPNQIATGGGADTLPIKNPIYAALMGLPNNAAAQAAFDQLSGEAHASVKTASIEDSRFVRDAALDRVRLITASASDTGGRPETVGDFVHHLSFWGQGFGAWGTIDGNDNAAALHRSVGGILVGADAPVSDTWRVGVLGGYSHADFDVSQRNSSGGSDDYHLGFYAGTRAGALGVRAGAAYTWHTIGMNRSVTFQGFSDKLVSNYDAATAQVFGDVGYRIDAGTFGIEPYANLAYVNLKTDGFNETGAMAALASQGDTTDVTFSTLGVRGSHRMEVRNTSLTLHGALGWRHAFGGLTPVSDFAFTGGSEFAIQGVPVAKDSAAIDAGFDIALPRGMSLGIAYTGQIASDAQDHGIKGDLNWKF
ncbi:MAG TPA: autotransporter domain-containing protein [Rhizomicrobium sp.]